MITIILADHFKKGMKSQGCSGLIPYDHKKNLFQQQYKAIRDEFPKSNILYVYGFDHKKFNTFVDGKKYKNIQYVLNPNHLNNTGNGYGLSLVKDKLSDDKECLILLGYEPFANKEIKSIKKQKSSCVVVDKKRKSKLGCVIDESSNSIKHIFFDLDNYVSNVYMLKQPEIIKMVDLLSDPKTHNMFLFEIMNGIITQGGRLSASFV